MRMGTLIFLISISMLAPLPARAALPSWADVTKRHLESFQSGVATGVSAGTYYVNSRFRGDCSRFFLARPELEEAVQRIATFEIRSTDYFKLGMRYGWLKGYREFLSANYGACEEELAEAQKRALLNRLRECLDSYRDVGHLDPLSSVEPEFPDDVESDALKKEVLKMALLGQRTQAWKRILESTAAQKRNISCLALWPLMDELMAPNRTGTAPPPVAEKEGR